LHFGKKTSVLEYFLNPRSFDAPEVDFKFLFEMTGTVAKNRPKLHVLKTT